MTTPVPADKEQDAPALFGAGVSALVTEARRLGITWNLTLATVDDPDVPTVICDGDTEAISVMSMIGSLNMGDRVYVLQVPPSGNFVAGTATETFPVAAGDGYGTSGGLVASSAGAEAAVPSASWNVEPAATLYPSRLYRVDLTFGVFGNTLANTVTIIRLRQGAQTTVGTLLGIWYCDVNPGATNAIVVTLFAYLKNTTSLPVSTTLSVTNQRSFGATNTFVFLSTDAPGAISVTDIGPTSDWPALTAVAKSVT